MTRRRQSAIAANPALVGAATLLVVIVATFLAYNANSGLPFVPAYHVDVLFPNADGIGRGADVRIGGSRVGRVMQIVPATQPGRAPVARLELALEKSAGPLPVDTRAEIRSVSALGARYVQLTRGHAARTVPDGHMLVVRRGGGAVDIAEVLGTFDAPTRRALRIVTTELGDGLAGRGAEVNQAVEQAPALLDAAHRVLGHLAEPRTGLAGFLAGADAATAAVAPQATALGRLLDGAATTAGAVADEHVALDRLLRQAPGDAAALTRDLAGVRGTLAAARGLARAAQPAARALPRSAARTAALLRDTAPLLARTPALAGRLGSLAAPVVAAARTAPTVSALTALTASLRSLVPTLAYVAPFQTRCNYLGLWARNVPDVIGGGDRSGTWFSYLLMLKPDEMLQSARPAADLHVDPYPHTGQADAGGQCEAGNERYAGTGQVIGNTPAVEPGATEPTTPAPDGAGGRRR